MRRVNGGLDLFEGFGVQTQFINARGESGLVEDAKNDFLAVNGGQNGNAKVVILATDAHTHASVLWQSPFGDVEAAHDFEARSQSQLQLLGRRGGVYQHAVNAITQAHCSFEWLQMHVAGTVFNGLNDDEVGEFDDGRFFAGGSELVEVHILAGFLDGFHGVGVHAGFKLLFGILDDVFY